jgi:hypothetical protein
LKSGRFSLLLNFEGLRGITLLTIAGKGVHVRSALQLKVAVILNSEALFHNPDMLMSPSASEPPNGNQKQSLPG